MKLNVILAQVSAVNLILNIALNYALMHWMGVAGIALGYIPGILRFMPYGVPDAEAKDE